VADPKTYTQEDVDAIIAEKDALKANRDEALTEAKRAKAALKAWDGKDPAKYDALVAASEEAEQRKAAAEGDFSKLRDQLVEKHSSELSAKDKRMGKLEAALNRRLVQDELRKALVGKADPTMMELLVEHGSRFVKVRETDDDFEHYLTDGKGNQQFSDGQATPMTIDLFVDQSLKSKFPGAFLGSGSSGGGASKSTAGGGGGNPKVIAAGDDRAFFANLKGVASGDVTVQ
jgi:hypothetical protein